MEALLDRHESGQSMIGESDPATTSRSEPLESQQIIAEADLSQRCAPTLISAEEDIQLDPSEAYQDENSSNIYHHPRLPSALSPVTSRIVKRLTSSYAQASANHLNGRLRYFYFGPTTNACLSSPESATLDEDGLMVSECLNLSSFKAMVCLIAAR